MSLSYADQLDRSATLFLNGLWTGASDQIWMTISDKWIWIPAYAILVCFIIKRLGWKKALIGIAAVLVTVAICDQAANFAKYHFARLRPCYDADMLSSGLHTTEVRGKGLYGFFSGHAANAFGMAAAVCIILREDREHRYGWITAGLFIWATLVSVSRVMVGKHFLGDIIVGALAGTAAALAAGYAARAVMRYVSKPKE